MKKEVSISIFAVLIVIAAILTVYYLNIGPTGFAVFKQQTKGHFDQGNYNNVLYNGSAVVLAENQTSGTYTSKIFDAENSSVWNNLTWQGSSGLAFEVRNCSTANCSDANFSSANLNNLNLSGQYFQYQVSFDANLTNETLFLERVTIDYSLQVSEQVIPVSVSLSEPTGGKSSQEGIPINFTYTGSNPACWFRVENASNNAVIRENTSLSGCSNTTFNLGVGEGNYVFRIYVNGSGGFASLNSTFSVAATQPQEEEEEESAAPVAEVPAEEVSEIQIPVESSEEEVITEIFLGEISGQDINQGDLKQLTLSVQNKGTEPVSECVLTGDDSGWVSVSDGAKNINSGESVSYSFSLSVPENVSQGAYTLGLSVTCSETTANRNVIVNVLQKKLDFEILNVQRTRGDRVRVDYSLSELAGEDQDVEIFFFILDVSGSGVANASQNSSIDANKTNDFRANIPINESLEGNLSLSAAFNSKIYSSSVLEPITLGAPTGGFLGGFAILEGVGGTGGIIIFVVVVLVIVVVFFVVRKMRKSRKLLGKSTKE